MGGRPAIPTQMKVLKGTQRADRRKNEPEFKEVVIPKPAPEYFDSFAKEEWARTITRIITTKVLTEADYPAFESYCIEHGRYIRLTREIEEEGEVIKVFKTDKKTAKKTVKKTLVKIFINPKCRLRKEAQEAFLKLAVQFGLTPSSRTKISVESKPVEDAFDKV